MDNDFSLVKNDKKNAKSNNASKRPIKKYTLDDYNKFRQATNLQIPPSILEKIKVIYDKTQQSKADYLNHKMRQGSVNTSSKQRDDVNIRRKSRKAQELSNEDWETMRNFKITQKSKKEGFEKRLDDIRGLLNKITDKTYDEMKNKIIDIIDNSIENNEASSYLDFTRIIEFVFDIVGTNAFYSKMYADLLCDLINKNDSLKEWLKEHFTILFTLLYDVEINAKDIKIGKPEEDYDAFCKINKENEMRRNIATFLGDFVFNTSFTAWDKNQYPETDPMFYLNKYYELFTDYGENDETQEECAESCEILCVLYNKISPFIDVSENTQLNTICKALLAITKTKKKELKTVYPGITNKTLFKLMDIKLNIA